MVRTNRPQCAPLLCRNGASSGTVTVVAMISVMRIASSSPVFMSFASWYEAANLNELFHSMHRNNLDSAPSQSEDLPSSGQDVPASRVLLGLYLRRAQPRQFVHARAPIQSWPQAQKGTTSAHDSSVP